MRILVGMPEAGSHGGPAACEPPFITELRRQGHEVVEEVYAYAASNSGLIGRVNRVLGTARRFKKRVRAERFDIIHINTAVDNRALFRDVAIVPRLSAQGPKIFLKFHGSDADFLATKNPVWATLLRRLLSCADGIGVLSIEEQENFLRVGVSERKVFVVKNVVEKNSQQRDRGFLSRFNLPDDRPLLLFIGRFIPAKGLLDVIIASGYLRDGGHKFILLCVGDGSARAEAEMLVKRLNLPEHVRFLGYIPEEQTSDFYVNSDLLLFPTYHSEGFPMVIFKAAGAGLPIITTRIRAAADYLAEPENCLWVESKSPDRLAEKIAILLAQPEERNRMSLNNRRLAERFSAETVTRGYLETYKRMAQ